MSREELKQEIFMNIAETLSSLSQDPRTKVGAVITRPDYSVVSMGYNGFPSGFPDTSEIWNDRELKNKIVLHAEDNAISYAQGHELKGCYIFVTHYPCPRCAAKIHKAGISKIFYLNEMRPDHDCELATKIIENGKVEVKKLDK